MTRQLTFGIPGIRDDADNPFHLSISARPLRITLHEESFQGLSQVDEDALRLLRELIGLADVQAVSTQTGSSVPHIEFEHKPEHDAVVVRAEVENGKSVGDVRFWSQWRGILLSLGTTEDQIDEAVQHVLVANAHVALNRDLLVTASPVLLNLSRRPAQERWNCLTPTHAIALCGLHLRAKGSLVVRRTNFGDTVRIGLGTYYEMLARSLLPESWRYTSACVTSDEDARPVQAMSLAASVVERLATALTALDQISILYYGPETGSGHGTLHNMLYHVQLAVVLLAGAFEAQAQLCRLVYPQLSALRPTSCSFRYVDKNDGKFKKPFVRDLPETLRQYVTAPAFQNLLNIIWAPRNLIQHRAGPARITFSKGLYPRHVDKLFVLPEGDDDSDAALNTMKEEPQAWGIQMVDTVVGIEPCAYLRQLIERAASALNDTCRLTEVERMLVNGRVMLRQPPNDELFAPDMTNRVRLLAGFPPQSNDG